MTPTTHTSKESTSQRKPVNGPVGLVLAGAVARGAYEAGALCELLPALAGRQESAAGQRPSVIVGTSAGAINAVFLASRAHLPAQEVADSLDALWQDIEDGHVFRPKLTPFVPWPHRFRRGLVSTSPLRRTLERHMAGHWEKIQENIEEGHLETLGIVATASSTGRSTVFVAGGPKPRGIAGKPFAEDNEKGIDYIRPRGGITVEHVLASAAVPTVFPPIKLDTGQTTGWFVDGGIRLNTPIKPAIALGARALAIISTDPARAPARSQQRADTARPDVDDTALALLQAALAHPLVEDVYRLGTINELIESGGRSGGKAVVPYLIVTPEERGELGQAASAVSPSSPTTRLLRWALGRQGQQGRELFSYAFFDPAFFQVASDMGRADAAAELCAVDALPRRWRTERLPEPPKPLR